MLDQEIQDQLKEAFSSLDSKVDLVFAPSEHENQAELVSMLEALASVSSKIRVRAASDRFPVPAFRIERDGQPTGISFRGIPGGHEFTSLVLAILNADGKGKMPDAGLARRIGQLKSPIAIKTYVSLTCENCPDVVQALNQMALLHPSFRHEMVDGAYAQDEVQALGLQGVPAVVADGQLIHSGRIHFLELLKKLEDHFGTEPETSREGATPAQELGHYDVVVVGGGPAGVSAAIYSVRKGLKTLVLAERMGGQVQETKGIENMVSVIYTEGPQLSEQMYKHLSSYPVTILDNRRVERLDPDRKIHLEGGETLSGDSVIITTGAKWRQLGVPGEQQYRGRGVAYCPHCDGPFYKGKKVAVIGGGNSGVEAAIDLAGIAGEVVVLEYNENLKADQILVQKLNSLANVRVITAARTLEIKGDGQKVAGLEYLDRKTAQKINLALDGVFIQIGLLPNSEFVKGTLELSPMGEIVVDGKGHTSAPGIYAAGDVTTTPFKQIIIAMGEGAKVALAAFEDRMRAS